MRLARRKILPLALLVMFACGCAQAWGVIGKLLDAANAARGIANQALCAAMPDAGSCAPSTSSGSANDAAGGER